MKEKTFNKLLYFTKAERDKRNLKFYKNKIKEYSTLDSDFLDMQYLIAENRFEYYKIKITLLITAFVIPLFMGFWKGGFEFIKYQLKNFAASDTKNFKAAEFLTGVIFIITFCFYIIILGYNFLQYNNCIAEKNLFKHLIEKRNKSTE